MAPNRTAIVWNPSKTSREDLARGLPADVEPTWHETSPDDPGYGAADAALTRGADLVIAAGGDGTVRAVAERLGQDDTTAELAVVPLGTGNLLARNLGVPLGDTKAALTRAVDGHCRRVDLGRIEADVEGEHVSRAFVVMAGIGIDAHMITQTDEDLKSKVGWLAYVESLGRALEASEVVDIDLAVDGAEPERTAGHTLLIGNCGTVQGGVTLLPGADMSDGELDLLLLSAEGIGEWLATLRSFVWHNGLRRLLDGNEDAREVESTTRARRLTVALSQPRRLEIDGEDLGEVTGFDIGIRPGALRVR